MNYTSIEQSKKLLELELSPESADMHYLIENFVTQPIIKIEIGYNKEEEQECINGDFTPDYIPCWSVGALLELMPKKIKKDDVKLPFHLFQFKDTWGVQYGYPNETEYAVLIENKTPLEAAYNMVVWLLENNYIKKEGNT